MTNTITRHMSRANVEDKYCPFAWRDKAVEINRELYPSNLMNSVIGTLTIDNIMLSTWRGDEHGTLPHELASDQIEDWLVGQAVKAVLTYQEPLDESTMFLRRFERAPLG